MDNTPYIYENEWFEETNVLKRIKAYLEAKGWTIIKFNENKTAKGEDIIATKRNEKLVIEGKGYPSDKYVKTTKRHIVGDKKPSNPKQLAKHWFGEALLSLELVKSKDQNIKIALGLPLMEKYENLLKDVDYVKKKLDIKCYFVDENGNVEVR